MAFLRSLAQKYKTLSIVGMAKNAGKTTTLNYLIEEAMDEGVVLGITSTGRDGENTDLVTGTDKPRVFLDTGTIVSVPVKLYELADAGLEILSMTKWSTPLGQVMLCRVAESGYVQIAGPLASGDQKEMCNEMLNLGAELVLIDGAIDRRSVAAPGTSDAIVLATGAVLSRNIQKVVEETLHVVNLYQLPEVTDENVRRLAEKGVKLEKITLITSEGDERFLDLKTGLASGRYLDEEIDDTVEKVFIPGALTKGVISDIHPKKLARVEFIIKDPTKIFIDGASWKLLYKKGFRVGVLENIKIAAITVNPYAPAGYAFEHKALLSAMAQGAGGIPVIDVKADMIYGEI